MSPEEEKLRRELHFVEDSYKSGIITKEEYDTAKARVESKLEALPKEEPKEEEAKPEEKPEPTPAVATKEEISKPKENVKLETYGNHFKIPKWVYLILLIVLIFFAVSKLPAPSEEVITPPVEIEVEPECNYDLDCQRPGYVGECVNPSTAEAACEFSEKSVEFSITIISSEDCVGCDIDRMKDSLKQIYPGAQFIEIGENEELISEHDITVLPAYLLSKSVEDTARFEKTKGILIEHDEYYLIKPSATGSPYFFTQEQEEKHLTLFMNPDDSASLSAFENMKTIVDSNDATYDLLFYSKSPSQELLRQICIREHSLQRLSLYLTCEDETALCLEKYTIPTEKINSCMQDEAYDLLSSDMDISKEFAITTTPAFVINNQYKKGGSLSAELLEELYCSVNECSS